MDTPESALATRGRDLAGHYESGKATISIDGMMAEDAQRETVLHELVHAILALTGGHTGDERTDERIAQGVGVGMLSVLRANPQLVEWLQEQPW